MKKLLLSAILLGSLSLTSCVNEEDNLFDKSAAERLNELKDTYKKMFPAQQNGWLLQYYPCNNDATKTTFQRKGYLIYTKFNADQSVLTAMENPFAREYAYTEDISLWRVIADNGPVLSFSSENDNITPFCDPVDVHIVQDKYTGANIDLDVRGKGIEGDYEFIVVDAPEDHSYVMLKGKKRGTYNMLLPMEEGVNLKDYFADVSKFQLSSFPVGAVNSSIIQDGETRYRIDNLNTGVISYYPESADPNGSKGAIPYTMLKRGGEYYIYYAPERQDDGKVFPRILRYNDETKEFIDTKNPNYKIMGYGATKFFKESLMGTYTPEIAKNWQLLYNGQTRSEQVSDIFKKVSSLSLVTLKKGENDNFVLEVSITKPKKDILFNFNVSYTDNGVVLSYVGTDDPIGKKFYEEQESYKNLISMFNQEFVVSVAESGFNLSTIKLTSVSNPNIWFVARLN